MSYPLDEWLILPEDWFTTHVIENAKQSLTADVLLQVGRSASWRDVSKSSWEEERSYMLTSQPRMTWSWEVLHPSSWSWNDGQGTSTSG